MSSCVNARGIPPAAYQALHLLSYPGEGYPIPGRRGGGTPSLDGAEGVPHPWTWGTPFPDGGQYPHPIAHPWVPLILTWLGYNPTRLDLDGVPLFGPGGGGTPHLDLDRNTIPSGPGQGVPPSVVDKLKT